MGLQLSNEHRYVYDTGSSAAELATVLLWAAGRHESLSASDYEAEQREAIEHTGPTSDASALLCDEVGAGVQTEEHALPPQHRAALNSAPPPSLSSAMSVTVS